MSSAGDLTQEQRNRIEANKRKALAKLLEKKAQAKGLVRSQFSGTRNSAVRPASVQPLISPATHNAAGITCIRPATHGQDLGISRTAPVTNVNLPSKTIHSAGQPLSADNRLPSNQNGLNSSGVRPSSINYDKGNKGSLIGPPSAYNKLQPTLTKQPSNASDTLQQNSKCSHVTGSAVILPGKQNFVHSGVSPNSNSGRALKNFYGPSAVTKTGPNINSKSVNQPLTSGIPGNRNFPSNNNNYAKNSGDFGCAGQPVKKVMLGGLVKGTCVLCSRERFTVEAGYHAAMVEIFKSLKTKQYDAASRRWSFKLEDYDQLLQKLRGLRPEVDISPLPPAVRTTFAPQFSGRYPERRVPEVDLSTVDPSLEKSLLPFQRIGVCFGVWRKGRVLIADDMGLGKTIQAICLACYYRHEWPLLVVVPSSVRFDWAQQLRRWIPSLDPQKINVIASGKDNPSSGSVVVISYDLMARKADQLKKRHFDVIIMDESHLLKNSKTARTKAALPLLQSAKRVILLSGTPCLSRPSELYTQIVAVCPGLIKFHDFGLRYCDGKESQWGWDFTGCSNMGELQLLLEEKLMIRRLKTDVLSQLPAKQRKMVLLDPSSIKVSKHLKNASDVMNLKNLQGVERRGALLDYFHQTATAKVAAVRDYVLDLLESGQKFLLFAHHQELLDAMETAVENKMGRCFIRIDGKTPSEQRKTFCDRFQSSDTVRMALLSITAANAGLNLTAASLVVFAELFWNPGILVQAEDRVHRIGQQDSVNVHYLVAPGTADDHIWPMVQNKLDVLSKAGLSKEDFSEADLQRMEDSKQKDLREYFEESFFEDEPSLCEEPGESATVMGTLSASPSKETRAASNISQQKTPTKQTGIKQFFKQSPKAPNLKTKVSCDQQDQSNANDEFEDDCDWLDDIVDWEENGGEPCSKKPKL